MSDYRLELRRFPKFNELKEQQGVYVALPFGKRVYVWFTCCKAKNICFVVDGVAIYPVHAAFESRLALGTILTGVLSHRLFIADGLHYEAGIQVFDPDRVKLAAVLKTLDCPVYVGTQMKFEMVVRGLTPFFDTPYKTQRVKNGSLTLEEKYATFTVTALPTSDLYELRDGAVVGLACIDTYDRSVFMNGLFRHMPENLDLDAGEESDEEPYELGMPLRMECRWHAKHKQWVPISVC